MKLLDKLKDKDYAEVRKLKIEITGKYEGTESSFNVLGFSGKRGYDYRYDIECDCGEKINRNFRWMTHGVGHCGCKHPITVKSKENIQLGKQVNDWTITKIIGNKEEVELTCKCGSKRSMKRKIFNAQAWRQWGNCANCSKGTSKKLNHDVFDDLSDPETLYWIGMLYADGYVNLKNNTIQLSLKDYYQIVKFKGFLKSEHDIIVKELSKLNENHSDSYRLNFRSEKIVNKLRSLGFCENKSCDIFPHDILKNEPAFWMGVIDGDGCINMSSDNSFSVIIAGNKRTCEAFNTFLSANQNIRIRNECCCYVTHSGKKSLDLIKKCYESVRHDLPIERKRKRYIQHLTRYKDIKILVLGHSKHGKDFCSEYISETYGLSFKSSSMFVCENLIFNKYKDKLGYSTPQECYDDRHNHRKMWFDEICNFNSKDKSKLAKSIFEEHSIYCGLRNIEEFNEIISKIDVDLVIWIDRSEHEPPESSDSCTVTKDCATHIIDNNVSKEHTFLQLDDIFGRSNEKYGTNTNADFDIKAQ